MKSWLKGGVLGGIIGAILIAGFFLCTFVMRGEGGLVCLIFAMPFSYALIFMGIDYFIVLFGGFFGLNLLLGIIIFILIGSFIGFLFDKEISWKKKMVLLLIIIIIITSLSINSNYRKYRDKKIIAENKLYGGGGNWHIVSHGICEKISIFNRYRKESCLKSDLTSKEKLVLLEEFKEDSRARECLKKNTLSYCVFTIAEESRDLDICELHLEESPRTSCIAMVSASLGDVSSCPKPEDYDSDPDSYRAIPYHDCIVGIVKNTKDITLCEKISKTNYNYDKCKFFVLKEQNDVELCKELENHANYDIRYRDDCFKEVAINLEKVELCDLAEHAQKKEDCLHKIAINTKNIELCKSLTILNPNSCIFQIAINSKDKDLCEELEDPQKEWCLDRAKSQKW